MPPSAIIDSDLDPYDNTIYYVAELDALWKATTLGGGNAAWTQIYDVANFDAALGSDLVIDRVRCARLTQNLLYSIGHALGTDAATYYEFCGVSSNGGQTWNWYQIGEIEDPAEGFTVTGVVDAGGGNSAMTASGGNGTVILTINFINNAYPICRYSATVVLNTEMPAGDPLTIEYDVTGNSPSADYDTDGDLPAYVDYQIAEDKPVTGSFSGSPGNYHFSGSIYTHHYPDLKTLQIGWFYGREGRWGNMVGATTRISTVSNLVIGGVSYGSQPSRAFDVAPTNSSWLYYGATDRVWKSEDGGVTWEILLEDTGAYDICVDPQIAGAIYFWNVNGTLDLAVGDVVTSTGLMTEGATNIPLRIARDPSSGRLLAIPNGTTLVMRNLGTNSDLKTGLSGGTGLHAYPGQKIIFVDNANIWISDDLQATTPTITAKKGGWAAYSGGVNAHRIIAA